MLCLLQCGITLRGGGSDKDVCLGRQTPPSRRHWAPIFWNSLSPSTGRDDIGTSKARVEPNCLRQHALAPRTV